MRQQQESANPNPDVVSGAALETNDEPTQEQLDALRQQLDLESMLGNGDNNGQR